MPGFRATSTATSKGYRRRISSLSQPHRGLGGATCPARACGRCVPGNASAPLRANPGASERTSDARIRAGWHLLRRGCRPCGPQTVTVWWGLFDRELLVEFRERRLCPYRPSGGPIPRHRYRKPRTSATRKRADRIGALARKLSVARAARSGVDGSLARAAVVPLRRQPFADPDPYGQVHLRRPSRCPARRLRLVAPAPGAPGRGRPRFHQRARGAHPRQGRHREGRPGALPAATVPCKQGEHAVLNAEIMARYSLAKDWRSAGFYETENHRQIGQFVPDLAPVG